MTKTRTTSSEPLGQRESYDQSRAPSHSESLARNAQRERAFDNFYREYQKYQELSPAQLAEKLEEISVDIDFSTNRKITTENHLIIAAALNYWREHSAENMLGEFRKTEKFFRQDAHFTSVIGQKKLGLKSDGIFGKLTRDAFINYLRQAERDTALPLHSPEENSSSIEPPPPTPTSPASTMLPSSVGIEHQEKILPEPTPFAPVIPTSSISETSTEPRQQLPSTPVQPSESSLVFHPTPPPSPWWGAITRKLSATVDWSIASIQATFSGEPTRVQPSPENDE